MSACDAVALVGLLQGMRDIQDDRHIDTDTQWAFWLGVMNYYKKNEAYLQSQIGNPEGEDKPNKKYYDPRAFLREGEKSVVERLKVAFADLNAIDRC